MGGWHFFDFNLILLYLITKLNIYNVHNRFHSFAHLQNPDRKRTQKSVTAMEKMGQNKMKITSIALLLASLCA